MASYQFLHAMALIIKTFTTATITVLPWTSILTIHRLFFSPLANFPGPKIAAASGWYEFYYEYFRNGHYLYEIKRMHEDYGKSMFSSQTISLLIK